jgi:hypothetical protein
MQSSAAFHTCYLRASCRPRWSFEANHFVLRPTVEAMEFCGGGIPFRIGTRTICFWERAGRRTRPRSRLGIRRVARRMGLSQGRKENRWATLPRTKGSLGRGKGQRLLPQRSFLAEKRGQTRCDDIPLFNLAPTEAFRRFAHAPVMRISCLNWSQRRMDNIKNGQRINCNGVNGTVIGKRTARNRRFVLVKMDNGFTLKLNAESLLPEKSQTSQQMLTRPLGAGAAH